MRFLWQRPIPRSADGGGAAAPAGPAADPAAPAAPATPAAAADSGMLGTGPAEPGPWKVPDWLPAGLRGEKPEATIDKLAADWKRQRDVIAGQPAVPKTADDYKYSPSDKAKPFVGDLAKDPVFGAAREAALSAGVPAAHFEKFLGGLYDSLADKNLLPKPYSAAAERKAYIGEQSAMMSDAQTLEQMRPHIVGALDFLSGLQNRGVIDQAGAGEMAALAHTASGLRALQAIQRHVSGGGNGLIPGGNPGGQGGETKEAWQARERDPRNNPDNPRYDRTYAQQTFEMSKRIFRQQAGRS